MIHTLYTSQKTLNINANVNTNKINPVYPTNLPYKERRKKQGVYKSAYLSMKNNKNMCEKKTIYI
jgi:hypothetical protein